MLKKLPGFSGSLIWSGSPCWGHIYGSDRCLKIRIEQEYFKLSY